MNYRVYTILSLAALTSMGAYSFEPQTGSGETDGYRLVWQDLFDNGELNRKIWNIEVNGDGGGNSELQFYNDAETNVRVGDDGQGNGCLILTAVREEINNRHFSSGRINTLHNLTFKHGKVEAAIKLPQTANGLWPAFWMMGNDFSEVGWPRCGETDICEFGNINGINQATQDRYFNGAMHWGQAWPQATHAQDCTRSYSLQDGTFHIFTCIWDENEVRMYVDLDKMPIQTPYFRMNIVESDPDNVWSPGNYFHKPNFIIFNLAVGGNFPQIWDPANITALNDANGHRASMYVNYVKVYQKGTPDEEFFNADPDISTVSEISVQSMPVNVCGDVVELAAPGVIEVFDTAGRCLKSVRGETLDLSALQKGCLIVRAGADGYNTKTLKIVR